MLRFFFFFLFLFHYYYSVDWKLLRKIFFSFLSFSPGIILIRKKKPCRCFRNWINIVSLQQFYSQPMNEIFAERNICSFVLIVSQINPRIRKPLEKPASVLFTRPTMPVTYSFHRFRECALDFHNSRISADVQPKHISQAYKEFRVIPCSCYLFTRQWFLIFATQAGRIQETRNLVSLFVSRNFFFTNPSSWIFLYIYKWKTYTRSQAPRWNSVKFEKNLKNSKVKW